MNTAGKHLILDIWMNKNVSFKKLKNLLATSLMKSNQLILGFTGWEFYPRGESGIFLIAKSHASFHTYPEKKYITVDVYTCDLNFSEDIFLKIFLKGLDIKKINKKIIERGNK